MNHVALRTVIATAGLIVLASLQVRGEEQTTGPRENPDIAACIGETSKADVNIAACTRVLEAEVRDSARRRATMLTFRALAQQAKGDIKAAVADLTAAIEADEGFAPAYEARGDLLRNNDQCDLALGEYEQVIKLAPERVPGYLGRGICLMESNENERAVADFERMIRLDPKNENGYAVLGLSMRARVAAAAGNNDGALADYDAAIKLDPKRTPLYIDRGGLRGGKGDQEGALADFNTAIKLDANNADGFAAIAWSMIGRQHSGRGEFDQAIAAFDQAIKLEPKNTVYYGDRSAAWLSKDNPQRAIADLDEVIKLEPDNPAAYVARGDIHRLSGDYRRAIQDYDRALEHDKAHLSAIGNRGITRFYLGEFGNAATDFRRVLETDTNVYSALYLYLSQTRAGRKDARNELTKLAPKLKGTDWPAPLLALYMGQRDQAATESAASTDEQRCEANFYIGELLLTRNQRPAAQKMLQTAADSCPRTFIERQGALEELKRLKQ